MRRTLRTAIAALSLAAATGALAGNPNPTESQDSYWDLKDQAAAWRTHQIEKARAAEREEKAGRAAPAVERRAKG
jgi:hypothetical protein